MNHHYYEKDQTDLHSKPTTFDFFFQNEKFVFHSDDGVFSKKFIDYGSYVLLKTLNFSQLRTPILDMGAGYGAICIPVAKLTSEEVYAAEINERAFHLLEQNAVENHVRIRSYHSDLYEQLPQSVVFQTILTNPPIRAGKKVVFAIYEGAYQRLGPLGDSEKTGSSFFAGISSKPVRKL